MMRSLLPWTWGLTLKSREAFVFFFSFLAGTESKEQGGFHSRKEETDDASARRRISRT